MWSVNWNIILLQVIDNVNIFQISPRNSWEFIGID